MESLNNILKKSLNKEFLSAIISNPREKGGIVKIKIRPVEHKDNILYQCEEHRNNQVFHHNLNEEEAAGYIENAMQEFKQMQMETRKFRYQVLVSKKGKMTIQRRLQTGRFKEIDLSHNRKKHYILEEGKAVPFLQDLGVMTKEGEIVRTKFDKFRQINRFLEFIEDILPKLDKTRENVIIDFGCGKSYLTFAMYYYLHEMKGYPIRIIGLDLKKDVISHCGKLAEHYGYDNLKFYHGDIASYEGVDHVDMVVTLHACDTATDYALYKAVKWGASVILSVPCCQHELNKQIENETLAPVLKYGLLKERMSALITDGLRAGLLEQQGYDTQILEFIDMEHTPKNILIRAVKRKNGKKAEAASAAAFENCTEALHADLTLEKLLSAGTSPAESYRSRRKNTENAKGESR